MVVVSAHFVPNSLHYGQGIFKPGLWGEGGVAVDGCEKARVAEWQVRGLTVLDMYSGIGFWTLPLLVAGAEKVFSSE